MRDSNYLIDRPAGFPRQPIKTLLEKSVAAGVSVASKLNRKSCASRTNGFTILELMITLAVAAIILATATPSIKQFRANNQITTANNSIIAGLNLARFSAVTRSANVLICPSADSVACSDGSWYEGWIVFAENGANNDADGFTPAEADIIRVATHVADLKPDSGFTQSVVFESDGTTTVTGAAMVIDLCYHASSVSDKYRQITISPFGLISSEDISTPCSG